MRKKVNDGIGGKPEVSYHAHPVQIMKRDKEWHACNKCNKAFSYRRHLEKHLQGHTRNDCKECNEMFTSRKHLVSHMREKHDEKLLDSKYACKYCVRTFTRTSSLYKHYRVHAEGRLVCYICGDFLMNKDELEKHTTKHEESRLVCILCHQTFARQQQFAFHMQSHDKYQCHTCSMGFSARKLALQHKKQGHNVQFPERFQCQCCSKQFYDASSLATHSKKHNEVKRHECKTCATSYESRKLLSMHFKTKKHLEMSKETRSNDKGYVCELCGKHFLQHRSLNLHRTRNHTVKRTFQCDFCSQTTTFKANLTRHIRLHLNDRRFICEQCGAAFYVLSALKDHCLYIHSDVRDHECELCQKKFKRSSELKRHIRSHSNARPHACTSCEKSFKRSSHLKRHKEKFHHEIKSKTRQVQRLKQNENGVFVPVPKESCRNVKKMEINLMALPYDDLNTISDAVKDITAINLENELSSVPTTQFLITLPTQTSDANLLYLSTCAQTAIPNDRPHVKSPPSLQDIDTLDMSKHNYPAMLLAPHESSMRNVFGCDVKLSDSMIHEPKQSDRDSPLCMSDLVRLQESSLNDFRNQDLSRGELTSPDLSNDCVNQNSNQYM